MMTVNGCSTCLAGEEKYEEFTVMLNGTKVQMYQYDYRSHNGGLFSCCARTLEECRKRRDVKLNNSVL